MSGIANYIVLFIILSTAQISTAAIQCSNLLKSRTLNKTRTTFDSEGLRRIELLLDSRHLYDEPSTLQYHNAIWHEIAMLFSTRPMINIVASQLIYGTMTGHVSWEHSANTAASNFFHELKIRGLLFKKDLSGNYLLTVYLAMASGYYEKPSPRNFDSSMRNRVRALLESVVAQKSEFTLDYQNLDVRELLGVVVEYSPPLETQRHEWVTNTFGSQLPAGTLDLTLPPVLFEYRLLQRVILKARGGYMDPELLIDALQRGFDLQAETN